MSTQAFLGRALSMYLGDGGSPETFTLFAGCQTTNLQINNEPVDITNNDSNGIRELLENAGSQSIDVSVEGIVNNSDVFKEVMALATTRTKRRYQIRSGMGDIIEADFVIQSFSRNGAYNEPEKFTMNFQSTAPLVWDLAT